MNKIIILLQIILGLAGVCLFIWTTRYKDIDIYYLIHFFIIFLTLTVISLVLWKNNIFVSYYISIIVILYFFYLIVDVADESFWGYYTFLFFPMGVVFLATIGGIEKVLRNLVHSS